MPVIARAERQDINTALDSDSKDDVWPASVRTMDDYSSRQVNFRKWLGLTAAEATAQPSGLTDLGLAPYILR